MQPNVLHQIDNLPVVKMNDYVNPIEYGSISWRRIHSFESDLDEDFNEKIGGMKSHVNFKKLLNFLDGLELGFLSLQFMTGFQIRMNSLHN